VALGGRGPRIAREKIGSDLQGMLPKSHILENRRSLKVQIILAENQNAPQVNLARHVFLAFATGGLGNTPFKIRPPFCVAGPRRVALFVRRFRRERGGEFLKAWIIAERIEHWIEPEQRRSDRHSRSQCTSGRYREQFL
jgi:hypothetical protein